MQWHIKNSSKHRTNENPRTYTALYVVSLNVVQNMLHGDQLHLELVKTRRSYSVVSDFLHIVDDAILL